MFEILIIAICLIMNAFLVCLETAFIATSRSSLRELVRHGEEKAKLLLHQRENPERTLSTLQLGITFFAAFAAAIGGVGAEGSITPWLITHLGIKENFATIISLYIVVLPLIYLNVVIGELVPKMLALQNPMYFAMASAPWLYWISSIINPFLKIFEWSTKKIIGFFYARGWIKKIPVHEETAIGIEGLSAPSKQYVLNIIKIEKTTVREILLEWPQVVSVDEKQTLEQVENTIIVSGHTRLPVVSNDEVRGIINAKEFLAFQKTGQTSWQSLIRPVLKIQENMPLLSALRAMQEKHAHMAIVYQGSNKIGIVTMEDIFEEIVGDIYDEDDDGTIKKILSSHSRGETLNIQQREWRQ